MDRKRLAPLVALACLVVFVPGCPRVRPLRVIFNQCEYGDSGAYSELEWSDFFGGASQLADDFELDAGRRTITLIQWWGAYRDNVAHTDDFTIRIFECDDVMLPDGNPVVELRVGEVDRTPTTGLFSPGHWDLTIYRYSTEVPNIRLAADRTYFISIVNDTGLWFWSDIDSLTQGDNYSVARPGDAGAAWDTNALDWAFVLWSDR